MKIASYQKKTLRSDIGKQWKQHDRGGKHKGDEVGKKNTAKKRLSQRRKRRESQESSKCKTKEGGT